MHGTIAPSDTLEVTVTAGGCPLIEVTGHRGNGIGGMVIALGATGGLPLKANQPESKKQQIAKE